MQKNSLGDEMKKISITIALLTLTFSMSLYAKKITPDQSESFDLAPVVDVEAPYLDDKAYEASIKEVKQSQRQVAAAETDVPAIENKFESDFKLIREELIGNGSAKKGITTPKELDQAIDKYSNLKVYSALSHQARFVALQLRLLKPYKSFFFRARGYLGAVSATRTIVVSMLRAQIAGIESFFPSEGAHVNHWEVVFKYLTEPLEGMGPPINSDEGLYAFITQVTNASSYIYADFANLVAEKKPIWWDNKLYFSFANFVSEQDRYVMLGLPEQHALLAAASWNLSVLYSTTAYSLNGLQDSVKSIGQLFGVDSLSSTLKAITSNMGADGMSSATRIAILNKHPKLFALMPDGKKRMAVAYKMLLSSARLTKISYEETKRMPEGQENLFDPRVANAFARVTGASLSNIDQVLGEKDAVSSALVNGERIRVSLNHFYNNPPQHLSELYPIKWNRAPATSAVQAWGKQDQVRNYKRGMATAWNYNAYKKIFPDIASNDAGKTTTEVPKYARILSQTWGAAVFAFPMAAIIF